MVAKIFSALGYGAASLILAFSAAWFSLSAANFSYGFWHDHSSIAAAIDKYGPKNRYKNNFHLTTKVERERLFGEIVYAIRHGGAGLADITFQAPDQPPQTLLREPEITHLQDVANLIDLSPYVVVPAGVVWLGLSTFFYWRSRRPPSLAIQGIALACGFGVVGLIVTIIGPVKVFNQLHIWSFPAGHQWFFYYQESLMSTMMHAPILFGWIAMEWVVIAILWYGIIQVVTQKILLNFKRSNSA